MLNNAAVTATVVPDKYLQTCFDAIPRECRASSSCLSFSLYSRNFFPSSCEQLGLRPRQGKRRRRLFCDNFHAGHALVVPPLST